MTVLPKVKRSAYLHLPPDQLFIFSKLVANRIIENKTYRVIWQPANALKEKAKAYLFALEEARTISKTTDFEINKIRKSLVKALNDVANHLDSNAKGSISYIINSGMKAQVRSTGERDKMAPARPIDVVVQPTNIEGCIEVKYSLVNPEQVMKVVAEWSLDGNNWHKGNLFSQKRGKIKDLPSSTKVKVRLRAISEQDLKSSWTLPVTVPVL